MSKAVEVKIFQTDFGYSLSLDGAVPRDRLGYEISFTSLNETLCYLFYDFGRTSAFKIVACEGDDTLEKIIDFEMDHELEHEVVKDWSCIPTPDEIKGKAKKTDNVLIFKPKDEK